MLQRGSSRSIFIALHRPAAAAGAGAVPVVVLASRCGTTCAGSAPVSTRDARAVRRPQRRAERDGHRHRGRQGQPRRRSRSARKFETQRRAATATSSSSRARSRRATCPTLLLAVATAGAFLHGSGARTARRPVSRRAGGLHGPDGPAPLPHRSSRIFSFSLVQLGPGRRPAHPRPDPGGDRARRERRRPPGHDARRDRLRERHLRLRRRAGRYAISQLPRRARARRSRSSARPARARAR